LLGKGKKIFRAGMKEDPPNWGLWGMGEVFLG
jgi:hypothetical protein